MFVYDINVNILFICSFVVHIYEITALRRFPLSFMVPNKWRRGGGVVQHSGRDININHLNTAPHICGCDLPLRILHIESAVRPLWSLIKVSC